MRNTRVLLLALGCSFVAAAQQQNRSRIDVQEVALDAQIDPRAQSIKATAKIRFLPVDDVSTVTFDLNNGLTLDRVAGEDGREIGANRTAQDMSVRVALPQTAKRGTATTVSFDYYGRLTGDEESPVFGIKFAAIQPEYAYLMYPARWFPVNDYSADRFAADFKISVPNGFKVVGSGIDTNEPGPAGMTTFRLKFDQQSFPGSIAVVKGDPKLITSGGVATSFYLRQASDMAGVYGEEISRAITYFSDIFGLPPRKNLTVVETEPGTPNGYSAPGILFFSPRALGKDVNPRLVANQVARQWWEVLVSPTTRNHIWITNGMARYAELLYLENLNGKSALETGIRDSYIEGLTVEQPPLIQSARFEDYAPEYWSATAGKGAAVLHMLRGAIGDEAFFKTLKTIPDKFAWKSLNTDDFRKVAEDAAMQSLNYFFLQWIESSGAPEFKLSYTVFRTTNGFRVVGKVAQDLDTFRMPVKLRIETEGNPEEKQIEVVGTSSEFSVDTFGKPKNVVLDPNTSVLRFDDNVRVAVQIKRGEQFFEVSEFAEALREYQKALEVKRNSSLAHYRIGEVFFTQGNNQSAANEFREALSGDLDPKWIEVWAHIQLGKIFDITDQRERALNEYRQAIRTKDNTQGALEEAGKYVNEKYVRPRIVN